MHMPKIQTLLIEENHIDFIDGFNLDTKQAGERAFMCADFEILF